MKGLNMTEEELKSMKLHEQLYLNSNLKILRVYGGWIYIFSKKVHCSAVGEQYTMTTTFVPL
jgi:hypothetical protein